MRMNNQKGFTLLEILIAISILTVGLLAVATMQGTALRGDTHAYSKTEASTLAQDRMEKLMADPFVDIASLPITGTEPVTGGYTVLWNLEPIASVSNVYKITVSVERGGRNVITPLVNKRSSRFR